MRDGNNGGGLTWDRSHTEADRRMRLLEMAGGDLEKAIKLECWVQLGVTDPNALAAPSGKKAETLGDSLRAVPDDLAIPAFLDRRRA